MMKRLNPLLRKAAPLLAGGMLLQAGGCTLDPATLAAGVLTSITNNWIGGYVFGAFNLVP
jgi:hypothetical protein